MDYKEIEAYLLEIPKFTKKNTLEDTRLFLRELGNPGKGKTVIHIAGTNGKGSVCAYLSSVLTEGGYRIGMFTSPHLVTMRERFRIGNEFISEEDFVSCFLQIKEQLAAGELGKRGYHPSFFEMLFFMAMLYFERCHAEIILLETGLGGRLDATNSVEKKDLCIITEIGLDHMEYLGNSVAEIAGEKAGILQKGVPVVYADKKKEASAVICRRAEELSCPYYGVSKCDIRNFTFHKNFIDFSYNTRYYGYVRCRLMTTAAYQPENAALALCALDVLSDRLSLDKSVIEAGMNKARWEGRMEEIFPGVYADGAHNPDGIEAFLETVKHDGCEGRRLLLFSAVREKQYRIMIDDLINSKLFDKIYLTEITNARGLSEQELLEAFSQAAKKVSGTHLGAGAALGQLLLEKKPEDVVYIAGSLYLVGEIKEYRKRNYHD